MYAKRIITISKININLITCSNLFSQIICIIYKTKLKSLSPPTSTVRKSRFPDFVKNSYIADCVLAVADVIFRTSSLLDFKFLCTFLRKGFQLEFHFLSQNK